MTKKTHRKPIPGRARGSAPAGRYWVCAAAILMLAQLSAPYFSEQQIAEVHAANWYFNYDLGYNHRGFMGSLFQLFYGGAPPAHEVVLSALPVWHASALFIALAASALLLFIPIARLKVHSFTRWLLLSFSAALLLAPAWRFSMFYVGSMDIYVLLCALAAVFSLIKKNAWLFAAFNVIGYLIHPQMALYSALFIVIIVHAVLNHPGCHARAGQWLPAAFLPLAVAAALYFVNSPEYNIAALEKYDFFDYLPPHEQIGMRNEFLNPGTRNRDLIRGAMLIAPLDYLVQFILFSIIPFAFVCFIAAVIRRQTPAVLTSEYPFPVPVIGRYKSLLQRADIYLLFAAAFAVYYPILFVALDFQRFLYSSQWMTLIVFIYLLWNSPAHAKPGGRKEKAAPLTKGATGACFVLAYVFAGAPSVEMTARSATLWPCMNFCIPLLTDKNPLGDFYSNMVYKSVKSVILPLEADAKAMRLLGTDYLEDYRLEGDALIFPEDKAGKLFDIHFTLETGEKAELRLHYSSASPPPLKLLIYHQYELPAVSITENEAVWHFTPNQTLPYWHFGIHTRGGDALSVEKFSARRI